MPSPKKYRIRTGARTASKVQERELIRKAKKLKKDPELILPKCVNHSKCYFDVIRKQIRRIQTFADNELMLKKFSGRGDPLARAYAATLLLAIEGKAPYLAPFKTPFGTVPFAMRGKTKREKLVAVQYYDDPKWAILGVLDIVKKKKLHVYSTKDGLICTGRVAEPPTNFVKQTIGTLTPNLTAKKNVYACPHLDPERVRNDDQKGVPYLEVDWDSAETTIAVCNRCANKSKEHTMAILTQRIADKNVTKDFRVNVIAQPICEENCKDCQLEDPQEVSDEYLSKYQLGEISDAELISKHLESLRETYKYMGKKIYIMDNHCYGPNLKAFIKAMKPTTLERRALWAVLKKIDESIIFDKATPSKILGYYWRDYGKTAIFAITHDNKLSKTIYKKFDINKTKASEILKEADVEIKKKTIISLLPTYTRLPPIAQFADNIARTYMTKGPEESVRAIDKYKGGDTKIKAVAYAFLLALNRGEGKKWQYTQTEHDFAQYLKEAANKLLESEPANYHDTLQSLLSATGSTEKIKHD
ncbi:hypothetical protein [[Eubacterium] cellulosolvens]